MKVHWCGWTGTCRQYSAPKRLFIYTKHWTYILGFSRSQVWTQREGFTDRWAHAVRHPL